jgi:hypothetical protein
MGHRISQRLLHIQTLIGMRVEGFRQLPVGHISQLVGIGSDELPNLTWDSRVHGVNSLFHLMRIQEWRVQYGYFEQTVMIRVE